MTPEQLDQTFSKVPDHLRTLRLLPAVVDAFDAVARSAGITLGGELSPEILHAVNMACRAHASPERFLAPILAELLYCSNFDAAFWSPLLDVDESFVQLAVQHCYYVLDLSGASGADELARLCSSDSRRHGARRALDHLASLPGMNGGTVEHLRVRLE